MKDSFAQTKKLEAKISAKTSGKEGILQKYDQVIGLINDGIQLQKKKENEFLRIKIKSKKLNKKSYKINITTKNKYKCPNCPFLGRDNHQIKIHLKGHDMTYNNLKKCMCNFCDFKCSKNNMPKHLRIHLL